mmetsp:Transcript_14539/g.39943  ORF Transcript_14539/g.39943 Transcript_14539/m.39943 type:complete len:180 (-) Transcript_14539:204-743(-)
MMTIRSLFDVVNEAADLWLLAATSCAMPLWRGANKETAHRLITAMLPAWCEVWVELLFVYLGVPSGLPRIAANPIGLMFNADFTCRSLPLILSMLSLAAAAVSVRFAFNACLTCFRVGLAMKHCCVCGELGRESLAHCARCKSACAFAIELFSCPRTFWVVMDLLVESLFCSRACDETI